MIDIYLIIAVGLVLAGALLGALAISASASTARSGRHPDQFHGRPGGPEHPARGRALRPRACRAPGGPAAPSGPANNSAFPDVNRADRAA